MDKLSLLQSVPIFNGLDHAVLAHLAEQMREERFAAGAAIFGEQDVADAFFIVDSGQVVISKRLGQGQEKILAIIGHGGVFGEMAFFSDSPRTADARARSESVLWRIARNDFLSFVSGAPEAGVRVLSGLLQVTMDRLEHTSRELATIYETGKMISSGRRLDGILKGVRDELLLAIPSAEQGAIFLYNKFNQEYDPAVAPEHMKEVPETHPSIGTIRGIPGGLVVTLPEDIAMLTGGTAGAVASLLVAPIVKNTALLGFLLLWSGGNRNAFTASHTLLAATVAAQLAEAIENIRYRQEEIDRQRLNNAKHMY